MKTLVYILAIGLIFSCKSQQENGSKKMDSADSIILSFYSIGEGTDEKAIAEFDAYMEAKNASLKEKIFSDKIRRGREGEFTIQITLSALPKKEKKTVLEEIKVFDEKYELVRIEEPMK